METEYLLGYGLLGDFGRFRTSAPVTCRRGDRAVARTARGVELGTVLRVATPCHAHFLPNTTVGTMLRRASAADERLAESLRQTADAFCNAAVRRAAQLELPLRVLDAELLLDAEHAVLHYVRWQQCDIRPLVSGLSTEFSLHVLLQDLSRSEPAHEDHGCGSCGSDGGCGSCESGGGCGTCGVDKESMAHFAGLREQMAASNRMPLV